MTLCSCGCVCVLTLFSAALTLGVRVRIRIFSAGLRPFLLPDGEDMPSSLN